VFSSRLHSHSRLPLIPIPGLQDPNRLMYGKEESGQYSHRRAFGKMSTDQLSKGRTRKESQALRSPRPISPAFC